MKETFGNSSDTVEKSTLKRHLLEMLIGSKSPPVNNKIRIAQYHTDDLNDPSATVDNGELLGRGTVAFTRDALSGHKVAEHSFEIRRSGTHSVEVTIRDHGNIL